MFVSMQHNIMAAMVEVNGADCNAESLMLDVVIHGLNLV